MYLRDTSLRSNTKANHEPALCQSSVGKTKMKNDNPKRMTFQRTLYRPLGYKPSTSVQILLRRRFESILVSNKH